MYDLTIELAMIHRKDLLREAERYYILYPSPSPLVNARGFYDKSFTYLGRLLSNLGSRLQARYGVSNKHPLSYFMG